MTKKEKVSEKKKENNLEKKEGKKRVKLTLTQEQLDLFNNFCTKKNITMEKLFENYMQHCIEKNDLISPREYLKNFTN
jgi:hypothetical protein